MTNRLLDSQLPQNPGQLNQLPTWQLLREFTFNIPNWHERLTLITWERGLLVCFFGGLMPEVYSPQDLIDYCWVAWTQAWLRVGSGCIGSELYPFSAQVLPHHNPGSAVQTTVYNDQTLPTGAISAAPSSQSVVGGGICVSLPVVWPGDHFQAAEALLGTPEDFLDRG